MHRDEILDRRQFDADMEEMRLHLELRQEERLQAGMTAEDAPVMFVMTDGQAARNDLAPH